VREYYSIEPENDEEIEEKYSSMEESGFTPAEGEGGVFSGEYKNVGFVSPLDVMSPEEFYEYYKSIKSDIAEFSKEKEEKSEVLSIHSTDIGEEQDKLDHWTPEEREQYRVLERKRGRSRRERMSPDELRIFNEKQKQKQRERWANASDEEIEARNQYSRDKMREYREKMTPEELDAFRERKREYQKKYLENMPEDQIERTIAKQKEYLTKNRNEILARRRDKYYFDRYGMSYDDFHNLPKREKINLKRKARML